MIGCAAHGGFSPFGANDIAMRRLRRPSSSKFAQIQDSLHHASLIKIAQIRQFGMQASWNYEIIWYTDELCGGIHPNSMPTLNRAFLRLPKSIKQGLTLLSGTTIAQILPAIAAPVITRLYRPTDFGTFAFVLAAFGIMAPVTCLRYDLAIMLPDDDSEATHITALCFVVSVTLASVSFLGFALIWWLAPDTWLGKFAPMLLCMVPPGIVFLGVQLIAQNWSLRTQNYRAQSIAMITQAAVTFACQTLLGATMGSNPYFLIIGTIAGYFSLTLVYIPVLREQVLPRVRRYYSGAAIMNVARLYRRFPIYTGPYAFIAQVAVRGISVILLMLTTTAIVGQYAVAQRVIFLPVITLMSAVSQIFFSRAARKLDDRRMPHMVRTALISGPLIVGPLFMLALLFGERIFMLIFGHEWRQAGRFAEILAVPSLVKTLTAWLDRIYDIRSRQGLSLTLEIAYAVIALSSAYVTLRVSGNADLAVAVYAMATVGFYIVWMYCALLVAKFDLRMGNEFILVSIAMSGAMILWNWIIASLSVPRPSRMAADAILALILIAGGVRVALTRMRAMARI